MSNARKDLRGRAEDAPKKTLDQLRSELRAGVLETRVRNLRDGAIEEASADLSFLDELTEEDLEKARRLDIGKVAAAKSRPIGGAYAVVSSGDDAKLLFGKHSGKLLSTLKTEDPGYLMWIRDNDSFTKELRELARTSLLAIAGLRLADLKEKLWPSRDAASEALKSLAPLGAVRVEKDLATDLYVAKDDVGVIIATSRDGVSWLRASPSGVWGRDDREKLDKLKKV